MANSANKTIDVASLTRISVQWDPILRLLPYRDLKPRIAEMGFRFLSNDKELREETFERKGGITAPYVKGNDDQTTTAKIGKIVEAKLVPEWAQVNLVEDIMNYENVNVVGNAPEDVDPQTKRHPLELQIINNVVRTVGEDILDSIYPAQRNENDPSPAGIMDGIDTKITALVGAGEISVVKGNQFNTGALDMPSSNSDTAAYDKVVSFLRSANYQLRRNPSILKMTQTTYFNVMSALANKLQYKGVMAYDMVLNALQGDANFSKLTLSIEPEMGTGNRLILCVPELFDFNLWTEGAANFVQIRNPFKNPNLVQYWLQFKVGTRVRGWNPKSLLINNGTPVAQALSGDYRS